MIALQRTDFTNCPIEHVLQIFITPMLIHFIVDIPWVQFLPDEGMLAPSCICSELWMPLIKQINERTKLTVIFVPLLSGAIAA